LLSFVGFDLQERTEFDHLGHDAAKFITGHISTQSLT